MSDVWPHGDPRVVARAIVGEPRFAGDTSAEPPPQSWLQQVFTWIFDRLRDLFHGIDHALGHASAWGTPLLVLLVLAIAAAAVVFAVRLVRSWRAPRSLPRPAAMSVPLAAAQTSAQWLAEALRLARDERWRDAAAALVHAALLALDECGRLRFDPSRTSGEARRMLRDATFDAFERDATTVLFAAGGATPDRFARLRETYARVFGTPA